MIGGGGPDVLVGSAGSNVLSGGDGDDRIVVQLPRDDSLTTIVTFRFRSGRGPRIAERYALPGATRTVRCP